MRQQRKYWHQIVPNVVRRGPQKVKMAWMQSHEEHIQNLNRIIVPDPAFLPTPPFQVGHIPMFVDQVMSNDTIHQLDGITRIRILLRETVDPPFDEVLAEGAVPMFVNFLNRTDTPELQMHAILLLNDMILHDQHHAMAVIRYGVIDALVLLVNSRETKEFLKRFAATFIGNLSQSSLASRDHILDNLPSLQLSSFLKLKLTSRIVPWMLYNLCRKPPPADLQKIMPLLPILEMVIKSPDFTTNPDIDACWALCFISDYSHDIVHAILKADDLVPRLVRIQSKSYGCLEPVLRSLCNIATVNTCETQMTTKSQILPFIYKILSGKYTKDTIELACWVISKITNGTANQIKDLFDANIISQLFRLWNNNYYIKQQIVWAVSNAALKGSKHQIEMLVTEGCLKVLCDTLSNLDMNLVLNCLQALHSILNLGEGIEMTDGGYFYGQLVAICGGWDKIKSLETCKDDDISKMSTVIVNRHWVVQYDEMYQNMNRGAFIFSSTW